MNCKINYVITIWHLCVVNYSERLLKIIYYLCAMKLKYCIMCLSNVMTLLSVKSIFRYSYNHLANKYSSMFITSVIGNNVISIISYMCK